MIVRDYDETTGTGGVRRPGGARFVTGALLSAAVSAGVALLYAPHEGTRTRRDVQRKLGKLQRQAGRSRTGKEAKRRLKMIRRRLEERRLAQQRARRRAAIIGAVVGVGVGVLLAPESGARIRRRLGEGARDLGRKAGDTAARLRGDHGEGNGAGAEEESRPVRTVQELGRDASDVF